MGYARYSDYKDSGVIWLGEIPSHWKVSRLKNEVTFNDETLGDTTDSDYEMVYVDISSVSLIDGIIKKEPMTFETSPSRARRIAKSGDVIVSTVRTYLKAIAQVENAADNLIVSTGFAVLRPKDNLLPKFLGYWVQSEGMVGAIVANSVGVSYPAINVTDLVRLPIIDIPKNEQTQIADFLDHELGKIDVLIEKQQLLLEKLAEQSTATITQAVTKGLDPNADMKESGIEWLNKIPNQWYTAKFKYLAGISYGIGGEIDKTLINGINLLSLPNVKINGTLDVSSHPFVDLDVKNAKDLILKKGDLLFNWRNGSSDHLGKTVYFDLDGDWTHVSFLLKMRFDLDKFNSKYFYYLLSGFRYTKFFTSSKAGVNNTFNMNELTNLICVVPPLNEQNQICAYLDEQTQKIDQMTDTINRTITRLKEYRSTLITQAVTGTIKVF